MLKSRALELSLCKFLNEEILADGVDVSPVDELSSLGIDSIVIMELIFFVERTLGTKLPKAVLAPEHLQSVRSLAAFVIGSQAAVVPENISDDRTLAED